MVRREGDHFVVGVVVFEIVVIVLEEEHREAAESGAVEIGDLWVADVAKHHFVRGAEDTQVADEMAGGFDGGGGVAGRMGGLAEVPVD